MANILLSLNDNDPGAELVPSSAPIIWANTSFASGHAGYSESGQIRRTTLVSTTSAIVEQATMSFLLGTLDSTLGENVIDCGTIS